MSRELLVATCGNCMAGDDSFGPRVGRRLRELAIPGVRVVDLDMQPAAFLDLLPGPDSVVLVDAVQASERPDDALVEIDLIKEELPALLHDDVLSSHGLALAEQLELARRLSLWPAKLRFLGAPIRTAEVGATARPELEQLVVAATQRIRELAGHA